MPTYEAPQVLASYEGAELIREAAVSCFYPVASDERLKEQIEPVAAPVRQPREFGTQ
jgi:hypothetical protein